MDMAKYYLMWGQGHEEDFGGYAPPYQWTNVPGVWFTTEEEASKAVRALNNIYEEVYYSDYDYSCMFPIEFTVQEVPELTDHAWDLHNVISGGKITEEFLGTGVPKPETQQEMDREYESFE